MALDDLLHLLYCLRATGVDVESYTTAYLGFVLCARVGSMWHITSSYVQLVWDDGCAVFLGSL